MPFYFLREDGSLKSFTGETTISRKPVEKIVYLKVSEDNPEDIYVKILDASNVIIRFGPGFRRISADEILLSAQSFIVHDQKTNKMCIVLWFPEDVLF